MKSIRTYIALVGIMPAFAFCQNSGGNASEFRQEFPLSIPVEDSQLSYWAKKEVKDSLLIDDMEGKLIWKKSEGIATISYTNEHAVDGKQALRFRTSLRDTVHLMRPENRTEWGSFGGQQGGGSKFGITFEQPQDWSTFNRVSIWVYIQPSRNPIHHFFLEIINQGTDYNTITPRKDNISQNLEQGKWINVVWEIPHYERDKVKQFNIFHTSIGYNPEGEDIITYDFDRLQMQRVETDPYEGWQISGEQFTFSHVGYRPQDSKAEASLLRGDEAGLQLVGKQLEWTFGNNPFGQSLMYGVGYNFAPQFAYCTKCVVGSLAVGMDCMQGDEPFWSGSNYATSKEMWIAPVNRVVGTIAAYMEGSFKPKATSTSSVQLTVIEKKENGEPRYTLQLKGAAGKHTLSVKAFNATSASHKQMIALTKNRVTEIPLDVQVIDKQKPYVLVVSVDNAMETKTEIVGAYY